MRIHSDGKEFVLTLDAYDELRDAFVALSLDPENKVLLLTGTGDYFIKGADMSTFGDLSAVEPWTIVASKGRRMIQSCIDVDIPVVAAVNGPIPLHSEIAFLADIVIAEENAWFQDPHMLGGVVPGDGIHAIWSELLGINRARTFLMLGKKLEAREAERLGIVAELAHKETVLTRAQEIANTLAGKKAGTLRNARQALTQRFSRIIAEGMAYGWPLEAISALKAAHTSGQ